MTEPQASPTLPDLLERLNGWERSLALKRDQESEWQLLRDAIAMLNRQATVNAELHRRVQVEEGVREREAGIAKLKGEVAFADNWALSSFRRMMGGHDELRAVYEQTLRANPDGMDNYHSVMDSRADRGPATPGHVWANRMSRKGKTPARSIRVVDAVRALVDEVLTLRGKSA